ncbi:Uncharacterised protein [Mycobacterium tuberculosis]|nr:Uncharacterised protein [Mycobacterium tuberculosis]
MTHHHTDRRLGHQRSVGHQVIAHQVIKRWCRDTPVVRITRATPVTGEMLEHRQHPGIAQTLRVRPGIRGDRSRIRAERPVPDHRVIRGVGDVDHRGEVDGDTQLSHLPAAVSSQVAHLLDGSGLCQFAGRRPRTADQRPQPGHPPAFLVDTHRQRQRTPAGNDLGQRAVKNRQVGVAADEDAADVVVGDHGLGVRSISHADHQQLGQLVTGGQQRRDPRRLGAAPGHGNGYRSCGRRAGGRRRSGGCAAMAAGHHQRCCRSEYRQCAWKSHPDMLSRWRIRSGLGARPTLLLSCL